MKTVKVCNTSEPHLLQPSAKLNGGSNTEPGTGEVLLIATNVVSFLGNNGVQVACLSHVKVEITGWQFTLCF